MSYCAARLCHDSLPDGRTFCTHHWFLLPSQLRDEMMARWNQLRTGANSTSVKAFDDARHAAVNHLAKMLVGNQEHDICNRKGCGAAIVWLRTRTGKWIAVDKDDVEAGDNHYIHRKHTFHGYSCKNPRPKKRKA